MSGQMEHILQTTKEPGWGGRSEPDLWVCCLVLHALIPSASEHVHIACIATSYIIDMYLNKACILYHVPRVLRFFHSCWCVYAEPGLPAVTATVSRDTAVIVKLTPAQTFDLIEQCLVSIRPATGHDAAGGVERIVGVSGNVLFLEGLLPGTEYSYRVAAMNGAGRSNFTEWVRFTTTATGE